MIKATLNGVVIAESDHTEMVEGNHYFPATSIKQDYFHESAKTSICPWKGFANYYDIEVNGEVNENAAWTYHEPKAAARQIKDHVAFGHGVKIETS